MPALPASPATLTSSRISVSGVPCVASWRSADSDATEWISVAYGRIDLTLRDWSWPMKCQRKSGKPARLLLQLLRAVLAQQREPGLGQRPDLVDRDVLDRGEDVHLGRVAPGIRDLALDPIEVGADAGGVEVGELARHLTRQPTARAGT